MNDPYLVLLHEMATFLAQWAYRYRSTATCGVLNITGLGRSLCCLYNSRSYADQPTLRDNELAQLRAAMRADKISEIAFASYRPAGSTDASYIMLAGLAGDGQWMVRQMKRILATASYTTAA